MPANQIPIHPEQSVRLSLHHGIMVRDDTAFTNRKGVEKRGIRRRTERALDKLQEPLRKILEPDEAVLYMARAQNVVGGTGQFFLGSHYYFLAPTMVVLTNRRLLYLLVAWNGEWKRSMRGARWGDIEEAKVTSLLGSGIRIKCRDGKKEVYRGMLRDDSTKIQVLLEALLPQAGNETSSALGMTSYCSECRAALIPEVYECPSCRLHFKDEKTVVKRSLLIPGGGFFYTGHPFVGMLHAMGDLILVIFAGLWIMVMLGIAHSRPVPAREAVDKGAALIVIAFVAVIWVAQKWILIRVSRKLVQNYIPAS